MINLLAGQSARQENSKRKKWWSQHIRSNESCHLCESHKKSQIFLVVYRELKMIKKRRWWQRNMPTLTPVIGQNIHFWTNFFFFLVVNRGSKSSVAMWPAHLACIIHFQNRIWFLILLIFSLFTLFFHMVVVVCSCCCCCCCCSCWRRCRCAVRPGRMSTQNVYES